MSRPKSSPLLSAIGLHEDIEEELGLLDDRQIALLNLSLTIRYDRIYLTKPPASDHVLLCARDVRAIQNTRSMTTYHAA
jgi:hypothetical protein